MPDNIFSSALATIADTAANASQEFGYTPPPEFTVEGENIRFADRFDFDAWKAQVPEDRYTLLKKGGIGAVAAELKNDREQWSKLQSALQTPETAPDTVLRDPELWAFVRERGLRAKIFGEPAGAVETAKTFVAETFEGLRHTGQKAFESVFASWFGDAAGSFAASEQVAVTGMAAVKSLTTGYKSLWAGAERAFLRARRIEADLLNSMFGSVEDAAETDRWFGEVERKTLLRQYEVDEEYRGYVAGLVQGLNLPQEAREEVQKEVERGGTAFNVVIDPLNWVDVGVGAVVAAGGRAAIRATRGMVRGLGEEVVNLTAQRAMLEQSLRTSRLAPSAIRAPVEARLREVTAQLADAEAKFAAATADVAKAASDAAAPSLARRAVGQTATSVGNVVGSIGRGVENFVDGVRDRLLSAAGGDPTVSKMLEAGARAGAGFAIGAVAGGDPTTGVAGAAIASLPFARLLRQGGQDLAAAGRIISTGDTGLSFGARLRQAEVSGVTRFVAGVADRASVFNRITPTITVTGTAGKLARGAAAGAAVGGAFGYIAGGGDEGSFAQGAGPGAIFGFIGGAGGMLHPVAREADAARLVEARRRVVEERFRPSNAGSSENWAAWQQLDRGQQAALANYLHAYPGLDLRVVRSGPQGTAGRWMLKDGRGVVYVNLDSRDPLRDIFAHELSHDATMRGMLPAIRRIYLGDPAENRPGIFTQLDANGDPVLSNKLTADGQQTYETNEAFKRIRARYEELLARSGEDPSRVSDEIIVHELAAEEGAQFLLGGKLDETLSPSLVGLFRDTIGDAQWTRNLLARLGVPVDADGQPLRGSGLFQDVRSNKDVQRLIKQHYRNLARTGRQAEISAADTGTIFTPDEVRRNPDVLKLFEAGGDLNIDPATGLPAGVRVVNGKWVITDESAVFLSPAQARARQRELAQAVMTELDKLAGQLGPDIVQARQTEDGRVIYSGRYLPDEVLTAIEQQNKFNPHQLRQLRDINERLKGGLGDAFTFFYQPAQRRLLGGRRDRGVRALEGHWRTEIPYAIQITGQNNIVVQTFSVDTFLANVDRGWNKGRGRELWTRLEDVRADAQTYLDNLAHNRPGEQGIGEAKKNWLNAAFGWRGKDRAGVNPLYHVFAADTRTPVISRRLDRMNRAVPVSSERTLPWSWRANERAKRNLRPDQGQIMLLHPGAEGPIPASGEEDRTAEGSRSVSPVAGQSGGAGVAGARPLARAEGKLPHAVKADELNLVHWSGTPGLKQVDQSRFGRGHATRNDLAGDPKSYFYEQGSPYGGDEGLINAGGKTVYGAKVSGDRIYDANADNLGIWRIINRAERDAVLKNAGYAGAAVTTPDGRRVVWLYEPVPVKQLASDAELFRPATLPIDDTGNIPFEDRLVLRRPQAPDTPEFRKWFSGSKVVDEKGQPLVVYHGTTADFDTFMRSKLGSATGARSTELGFYFTDNPLVANVFARRQGGDGGNVMPVYLSLENPLVIGHLSPEDRKRGFEPFEALRNAITKASGKESWEDVTAEDVVAWRERVEEQGYDGIILLYTAMDGLWTARSLKNPYHHFYIAFRPEQIKSAIGNRGTFDPKSPSILDRPSTPESDAVVAKYPDVFTDERLQQVSGDQLPVEIRRGEGVEPALFNGYYELPGGKTFASIATWKDEAGGWSHGVLPADQIITKVPSPEEWRAQRATVPSKRVVIEEDSPLFRPAGNEETQRVADGYMRGLGRSYEPHTEYAPLPEEWIKKVADVQEQARHSPDDPEVQRTYDALKAETLAQYEAMVNAGIEIRPWTKEGQPYANSQEMMADVRDNKRLYFFLTEEGFGTGDAVNHPLMEPTGIEIDGKTLLYNDLFRAVHDYFGHTQQGWQFGPRGEYNAWLSHARMFSDAAQPALAAETLAQNAWVNNGPHLRDESGRVPKKGEPGYVPVTERPYSEQKAYAFPQELIDQARGGEELHRPQAPDTPEFREWFGESKVVDEEGKPLVVFHGTRSSEPFEVFDTARQGPATGDDLPGSYFTDSEHYAMAIGPGLGKSVGSFFLRIENPARGPEEAAARYLADNQQERPVRGKTHRGSDGRLYLVRSRSGAEVRRRLENQGFDGVIRDTASARVFIAFSPEQIKSIENRGAFDPNNPSIFDRPGLDLGRVSPTRPSSLVPSRVLPPERRQQVSTREPLTNPDMKQFLQRTVQRIKRIPGFTDLRGSAAERAQATVRRMADNIKFVFEQATPDEVERWQQWYPIAHDMSARWADEFDRDPDVVSAVNARLSPQKDWYLNVTMTRRVLETLRDDPKWTEAHLRWAMEKLKPSDLRLDALRDIPAGTPLSELDDQQAAFLIRAQNELFGDRKVYDHEGNRVPGTLAWQPFDVISSAVRIARKGDYATIDRELGGNHKVRSFYNNHVEPDSPYEDVTIDTHAGVVATLMPYGANSAAILDLFGGVSHAGSGYQGTYYLYADAFRTAAHELGKRPREVQSVTWEKIRQLLSPAGKRKPWAEELIGNILDAADNGELDRDQARQLVLQAYTALSSSTPKGQYPAELQPYLP